MPLSFDGLSGDLLPGLYRYEKMNSTNALEINNTSSDNKDLLKYLLKSFQWIISQIPKRAIMVIIATIAARISA